MAASGLKNLDFKTAGFWPEPMKMAAYAIVFVAVIGLSWLLWFSSQMSELKSLEGQEKQLRDDFEKAQTQANNLPDLKQELDQINELLKTLVTRLPNKNEIPQLVVDVSQAAIANGLYVDLFEPQDEIKKEFYAEKQIKVKFRGGYHQLGAFFSEVAKQPRLVSVVAEGMKVETAPKAEADADKSKPQQNASTQLVDNTHTPLVFSGTVRTYRYLSEEEEEEVAKATAAAEAEAKKKERGKKPAAPAATPDAT